MTTGTQPTVRVHGLKVDQLERPLGLENPRPRLSWQLESSVRGIIQSAYRIRVASSEALLESGQADLWDSGKISSNASFGVAYEGQALISRQICWWSVQVWDQTGTPSDQASSSWEMGLLGADDWVADWLAVESAIAKGDREAAPEWIWGAPLPQNVGEAIETRKFRFHFRLSAAAESGEFFAFTNDWFARVIGVWLNGAAVPDPGWERAWVKRLWFDVGPLTAGEHVIAIEVSPTHKSPMARSTAGPDGLLACLRLELVSGETVRFCTGEAWKTTLTQDLAWPSGSFDDNAWPGADLVAIDYHPAPPRPAMYLRRVFKAGSDIVRARLYATALGAYEARINGRRVGSALFAPESTQYAKRVHYGVYDVTDMVGAGENVIGFVVGDGWYGSFDGYFAWGPPPLRLRAQLELRYADGSSEIFGTAPGEWRTSESPIRVSELRVGEIYDARLDQPGWDQPGFDEAQWGRAELAETPAVVLTAQVSPPIRAVETLKPQSIAKPRPAIAVYDFARHFAGWCRLHAAGPAGTRITLRFGEVLDANGEVDQSFASVGEPKSDQFILKGTGHLETFEPHFTYRGIRYVQVEGLTGEPTLDLLEGIVLHSDLPTVGSLRLGHPIIQRLWENTFRTQQSNFVSVPTDCPSREQRAHMGDPGLFWDAAAFNMDLYAFTSRQMANVRDDQAFNGALPMTAPQPQLNNSAHSVLQPYGAVPAWSEAGIILPWVTWLHYGNIDIIEDNWPAMMRHVRFIAEHNSDYIWRQKRVLDLGDWLALDQVGVPNDAPSTPRELFATAYWAHATHLLALMGEASGRTDQASNLRSLFQKIRGAFAEAYVSPDGRVGDDSQTSYILALKFGLVPSSLQRLAAEHLARDVSERGHLTTGIVGTAFALDVLADSGFGELAYDLLLRTEYPSWGYMIENGATTIWENWSASFPGGVALSRNHFALGSPSGFLFRRIAGIDADEPGFKSIVVRPLLDPRVRTGGGDYQSVSGRISTDWSLNDDGAFKLQVLIPGNSRARIHLPAKARSQIEESGVAIEGTSDLVVLRRDNGEAVIAAGSGRYQFTVSS